MDRHRRTPSPKMNWEDLGLSTPKRHDPAYKDGRPSKAPGVSILMIVIWGWSMKSLLGRQKKHRSPRSKKKKGLVSKTENYDTVLDTVLRNTAAMKKGQKLNLDWPGWSARPCDIEVPFMSHSKKHDTQYSRVCKHYSDTAPAWCDCAEEKSARVATCSWDVLRAELHGAWTGADRRDHARCFSCLDAAHPFIGTVGSKRTRSILINPTLLNFRNTQSLRQHLLARSM